MSDPARWTEEEYAAHMAKFHSPGRACYSPPKPEPRVSQPTRGVMNKGETLFAQVLESRKTQGIIKAWRFEAISLLLAPRSGSVAASRYTPDFSATLQDGRTAFYEVKAGRKRASGVVAAHFEDGAREKLLWAAREWPEFDFYLVWRWKNEWNEEKIK